MTLTQYLKTIETELAAGNATEHTHRPALKALVEMARWSYRGHADSARLMLGRIAGIDEKTLIEMLERQEVEPIINAVTTQKNNGENARCGRPLCSALR